MHLDGDFDAGRCAEIIVGDAGRRGSGYLIADALVLTAHHVVADAGEIRARFDAGRPDVWTAAATVAWHDAGHDVALLRLDRAARTVPAARFGSLPGTRAAVIDVHAAGFPRWKLRRSSDRVYRDLHDAHGSCAVVSNRRSGTLEITVEPPGEDPDPSVSPWAAMSGAAVWSGGRIIGVVAEHHRSEGLNRLTARRIDGCLAGLAATLGQPVGAADVVPVPIARRVRSGYTEQVRDIAPAKGLIGRDTELAELTAFCAGDESYVWWQATPWAGKSALMSTFVLHPPDGVDVVSFFVTGRLASQSDSEAFTDALLDQLQALLEEAPLPSLSLSARDAHRRDLLRRAAQRSRRDGRRLVLVVDGLDEDTGTAAASRLASIASLLPKDPADGLRVVLAGRPHPPIPDDVPADHPLRTCRIRPLAQSQHAQAIEHDATRELQRLLTGDQTYVEILGLLAASGGGLSQADLADLTGQPPFVLATTIHSAFGRTIARRSQPGTVPVYLYAHETLRVTAEQQLGHTLLSGFRARILTWADGYRAKGWPRTTPAYLLDDYPRMLFTAGAVDRLVDCAIDPDRHDRLLEATSGDAAALAVIRSAHALAAAQDEPDLLAVIQLTMCRERLAARNANIPTDLPSVWAALGYPDRAESLARSITDPHRQAQALTGVVEALATAGRHEQAATAAAGIDDPAQRAWALANLAETTGRAGQFALATQIADTIPDAERRAWILAGLVEIARAAGARDEAARIAKATCALTVDAAVVAAVRAVAADDLDLAAAVAGEATEPARGAAMVAVVEAALDGSDHERALALAETITDPSRRTEALRSVAHASMRAGDYARAVELVAPQWTARPHAEPSPPPHSAIPSPLVTDRIQAASIDGGFDQELVRARLLIGERERDEVLTRLVQRTAAAGDCEAAQEALAHIADPADRVTASVTVAAAFIEHGQLRRAVDVLDAVDDPVRRAWASTSTARTAALRGDVDAAITIADRIADPARRALALGLVTGDLVEAGRSAQATAVADLAAGSYATITHASRRSTVLSALVSHMAAMGNTERAMQLAEQIPDQRLRNRSLVAIGAQAGDEQVAAIAASIGASDDAETRARGLIGLAAGIEQPLLRQRLMTEAAEAADQVTSPEAKDELLAAMATHTGGADALVHVRAITADETRATVLVTMLDSLTGHLDEVMALAALLPRSSRARVLAALADLAVNDGDHARAAELVRQISDRMSRRDAALRLLDALDPAGPSDLAVAVASDLADPALQAYVLGRLTRAAVAAGDLDLAARAGTAVTDAPERAVVLSALVDSCAAAGRHELATVVAQAIVGASARASAFAHLARTLVAAGNVEAAAAVTRLIEDPATQAAAMTELAACDLAGGDFDGAAALTAQIHDPALRAEALTALAVAAAEAGAPAVAQHLAGSAAIAARNIANSAWRQDALRMMLHATLEAGERTKAVALCRAQTDPHRRSEGLTLLALDAVRTGYLGEAVTLLPEIDDVHRRAWVASVLAQAAVTAGDLALAEDAAAAVVDAGHRAVTQVVLAEAALRTGRLDAARAAIAAAPVAGIENNGLRMLTLMAWGRVAIAAGDLDAAVAVAAKVVECTSLAGWARAGLIDPMARRTIFARDGSHPTDSWAAAWSMSGSRLPQQLSAWWQGEPGVPARQWAIGTLAAGLADAGSIDRCLAVIRTIPSERDHGPLLAEVAERLAIRGRIADALAVAAAAPQSRVIDTVGPVILAAARRGDTGVIGEALRSLPAGPMPLLMLTRAAESADPSSVDRLIALAHDVVGEDKDQPVRAAAALALADAGHHDHARRAIRPGGAAVHDGVLLVRLAIRAVNDGRLDVATAYVDEIHEPPVVAMLDLSGLVRSLAQKGGHTAAIRFARNVVRDTDRSGLLAVIVNAVAETGAVGDALTLAEEHLTGERLLEAIATVAGMTSDEQHRWHAARLVEQAVVGDGEPREPGDLARLQERGVGVWIALGRLDDAVALAESISVPLPRTAALNQVIVALAAADRIDDAVRVTGLAHNPAHHASMTFTVARTLALAGRQQEALAAMSAIQDEFHYVDGLMVMVEALVTAVRRDLARALAEVAAPHIDQVVNDAWREWAGQVLAKVAREPTEPAAAVEAPVPPAEPAAPPAEMTRRALAELLMGPQWADALPALRQLDPDTFRHVPELLLRDR